MRLLIRCLLVSIAVLLTTGLLAQNDHQDRFEAGAGFSNHYFVVSEGGINKGFEVDVYGEWRHSINRYISLGARVDYNVGPVYCYGGRDFSDSGYAHYLGAYGVATLHLFPNNYVTPFLSLGVGPAGGLSALQTGTDGYFMLSGNLRVGFELFRHLRIAAGGNAAFDIIHASTPAIFHPIGVYVGWAF